MKPSLLGGRNRGVASMCDYSLDFVASQPAKVGDKLVTTKFKIPMSHEIPRRHGKNSAQNARALATFEQ